MKKILTLIKLTVTAVAVTVLMGWGPVCPPPGSGINPLFPNPDNCNQYFQCDNGVAILVSCPWGLWFCSRMESCTWSWNPEGVFSSSCSGNRVACAHWVRSGASTSMTKRKCRGLGPTVFPCDYTLLVIEKDSPIGLCIE